MSDQEYIVELETGVWLAPWNGQPRITQMKERAAVFTSKRDARQAISEAFSYRDFDNPLVVMLGREANDD